MSIEAVREAVTSGEYRKAAQRFEEYARALPPGQVTLDELEELLGWTKLTVRCAHAQMRAELQAARDAVAVVAAYSR
jgi:hypothetical protein